MDILINFGTFCNRPHFFPLFATNIHICLRLFWHKETYCAKIQFFALKKCRSKLLKGALNPNFFNLTINREKFLL